MRCDAIRGRVTVALAVMVTVFGAVIMPSGHVAAGAGLSATPTFPGAVTVGQTGIAASITITNNNTPPDVATTLCRHDDSAAGSLAECFGAEGIVLTPSCGAQSPSLVICTATGADPNVFQISPTGAGSGACAGSTFTTVPLNDAFGRYRFDPPPGTHVVLPGPGSACTISFTLDVLKMPSLDRQAAVPGVQTAQIVIASAQTDGGTLGSGQGTTTPVTLSQAVPSIVTDASPSITLGAGQMSDQATVTGVVNPVGAQTVTFRLYGPGDATCAGVPVFISTGALSGGVAQSGLFTPTDAGTYRWVATYDGDVNNASVSGACGDAAETRAVAEATPTIATQASPDIVVGAGQLSDQATVTGLVNPTGSQTVTFELFGPGDATCAGTPVFISTVPLTGGAAQSASFTPTDAGTYRWVATYNGDLNNVSVSGRCGDPTETTTVAQATPAIVTVASPGIVLGVGQLSDQATVTGLVNPTGTQTVTFDLFAPVDVTCAGPPVFTSTVVLVGGVAQSAAFAPTDVGTYRWVATYDGDVNNVSVSGSCGDETEMTTVGQAIPAITTLASTNVVIGAGHLSDQATVTGLVNPIGAQTVTFQLYGPADATCANEPAFTSTVALTNGTAQSAAFTPTHAGTYRWVATYDGDVNNASVSGTCGDATEMTTVGQATPTIATLASPNIALGAGQLSDQATVTGLVNPTGSQTVTFRLYGPADATCAAAPVLMSTVALTGGSAQSASFVPTAAGTYRWVATYDGDANNSSVSGACGDPTETRAVARATPTVATQASPNIVVGSGQLSDQATVTGLVNPTGAQTVTFRLYGVADATCAAAPVFTSTVALTGGAAQSASFTPTAAGTYRWVATYDGDANNFAASGTCGDPTETATATAAPLALPPTLPPTGTALDGVIALALGAVVAGALMVRMTRRMIA